MVLNWIERLFVKPAKAVPDRLPLARTPFTPDALAEAYRGELEAAIRAAETEVGYLRESLQRAEDHIAVLRKTLALFNKE